MSNKRAIVNIVNFIRGCEPREKVDLVEPVREQLALLKKYGFPGTFLLQYDALEDDTIVALFADQDPSIELGVWLEIVEPQCHAAEIDWRGRFPWDWHANVGFSVGYTEEQRERLIDVLFARFKEIFGRYPATMGSWIIDAHSLTYAREKYGIVGSCNCKDQWGTDGYTLWGAYWNQAYYPAKKNAFCPAQTASEQIDVPIFRMLGSDPLRQYDAGLDPTTGAASVQGVITLEPVYKAAGGGNPGWVDWYLTEALSENCLHFANTQVGQENSFGWPAMRDGLCHQFERLKELSEQGKIAVETLEQSAKWFRERFELTPATTICALSPWEGDNRQSVWYNCRNYRINLIKEDAGLRIRDLYLFREDYPERYRGCVCTTDYLQFDNLPVIDGNRFSGHGILAGGILLLGGEPVTGELIYADDPTDDSATVRVGALTLRMEPTGLTITTEGGELSLLLRADPQTLGQPDVVVAPDRLTLCHRGFAYKVTIAAGSASRTADGIVIRAAGGKIVLRLDGQ